MRLLVVIDLNILYIMYFTEVAIVLDYVVVVIVVLICFESLSLCVH